MLSSQPPYTSLQDSSCQLRELKVYCAIDGDAEHFDVDINDNGKRSDFKKKVEQVLPEHLRYGAFGLPLYRAPEGVDFTEPGVTVGAKDEIGSKSPLRGMFTETDSVQVIVRPPSYNRVSLKAFQYDRRSGYLVWKEDTFSAFPVDGERDFKALRQLPEFCFFDKTDFIMALESCCGRALVFLRPRRSGKTLTLSTLAHFHGREHLPDYEPLFKV
ncbi:hypothetical protein BG004_006920 [Podila humilis]|nr:hypothetical protein BG004_006920 [Podila humilis]